jgi:hypothetical protein
MVTFPKSFHEGNLHAMGWPHTRGRGYNFSAPVCTHKTEEIEALPPFEATKFKQAENF